MSNAVTTQDTLSERTTNNTQAFRFEYKRLNQAERKIEQKAFCKNYEISPVAFRARLSGSTNVSDTELTWFKKRVSNYFQN